MSKERFDIHQSITDKIIRAIEPRRVCRRPFGLNYAAMAGSSSMA